MAASNESVATTDLLSYITDFSSESTESDGWQELTKSDYAKVIFSDILCTGGTVECKFQITDNVHEDPNDCVGLFRVGYDDLSQCLVSKMLSQTKCEDDGKLQRCVFTSDELPSLDDGFYQFLYVTRDKEVCGASMPFQIKMSPLKESSTVSSTSENMDAGFLLVSNDYERLVKGVANELEKDSVTDELDKPEEQEYNEHEKVPDQPSTLSEQKKEEIAAWVSQNPDYYSLIEQIKEHTYTINALQESKDLAMKEVAQLYEILNKQNGELIQYRNMLAAYEEKIKMSQNLLEEKNSELIQMRNMLAECKEKLLLSLDLQEQKNTSLIEMRKSLTDYEEKIKLYELLLKEKDEQVSQVKKEFLLQEEKLKTSLALQDQQQTEINDLNMELQAMNNLLDEKESCLVTAERRGHSMDSIIREAQELVCIVSTAIKNLNFTNKDEVEKFFQLKIQLLIVLSKMTRATDQANIYDRNELNQTMNSVTENVNGNSSVGPTSCALENTAPLLTSSNTNVPEVEKHDSPMPSSIQRTSVQTPLLTNANVPEVEKSDSTMSSIETLPLPELEPANEGASKEIAQRIPYNRSLTADVLEYQIIEMPQLNVINEDTAKTWHLYTEDIARINLLTEKMRKRGSDLFGVMEVMVDDSSSDSGSDVSEMSECSSSVKKDLTCVARVMEALSSFLSNQSSLEQLLVVKNEEDKVLIQRSKYDVLLQKCALRYQIEILLEHIEKQKEGIKKVSEKICDLLTKCMVLKDEVCDLKTDRENLQTAVVKKDMYISKLEGQLAFRNSALFHLCSQKEELESRSQLAERINEDFRSRIVEASDLYKQQYRQIEKLSKKLQRYKAMKDKTKSPNEESSLVSSESSNTTSSFEVVKKDSVNDSDTGEHMFAKESLISNEKSQNLLENKFNTADNSTIQPFEYLLNGKAFKLEDPCDNTSTRKHGVKPKVRIDLFTEFEAVPESCQSHQVTLIDVPGLENSSNDKATDACSAANKVIQTEIDSSNEFKPVTENPPVSSFETCGESMAIIESKERSADKPNTGTLAWNSGEKGPVSVLLYTDYASYEHFQEIIKDKFANIKKPATSRDSQECFICCYICKVMFPSDPENPQNLMNHLENEHSMKICPVCGQLFEDAIPHKYFQIHVHQHFETE